MPSSPMRIIPILVPLSFLSVAAAAQQVVRPSETVEVRAATVEIYDAVGTVTLTRVPGNHVTITATAEGPDGRRLRFLLERDRDRAVFSVAFPDVDRIASPRGRGGRTQIRLRRDGTFAGSRGWSLFGSGGDRVEIGSDRGFRGWADVQVGVPDGQVLRVHVAVGEVRAEGVSGDVMVDTWSATATANGISGHWLFDVASGVTRVSDARGTLRIDGGSGTVTVTGMTGELLDVDLGSGRVDVSDADVDRFRFDTGSGPIRARGLRARRGVADTGSGSVELEFAGGRIDDLVVDTGSGSVALTLPEELDARVTIDTGSGGVRVQRTGALFERRDRDGTVLRFGEGRGRILVDTGSGSVTIR